MESIGLVGFNTRTGLGELNRQIVKFSNIYSWLVKPHPHKQTLPLDQTQTRSILGTAWNQVIEFVKSVDIIVFCETPYYGDDLVTYAKGLGKRVVCIPMQEWMPANLKTGWVTGVDLFMCPTYHCYEQFQDQLPCTHFPWPKDVDRFTFKQRTICNQFLFINGNGGWQGRKGLSVIREALKLWPEMPLKIHDQVSGIEVENNSQLYAEGDVLLCPHSVDGLCLEIPEARLSGLPVIATDGKPWVENELLDKIKSEVGKKMIRRLVDWYLPSPENLVEVCKKWLGQPIAEQSLTARKQASYRSWSKYGKDFTSIVRGRGPIVDTGGK